MQGGSAGYQGSIQFLLEFRQRREVYSGSLHHRHHKCQLKTSRNTHVVVFVCLFVCLFVSIWGKMRTAAQETVPQIAEKLFHTGRGKGQCNMILMKGEYKLSQDLSCQFPSTECLISALHPELLQGLLKVSSCST